MFSLTILNVLKVYETRLDGHSSFESHVHVIVCLLTKSKHTNFQSTLIKEKPHQAAALLKHFSIL